METPNNNRLLVVDDEKDIVQAYVDFLMPAQTTAPKRSSRMTASATPGAGLEGNTFEILRAYSGDEALALFKKEHEAGRRIAGGFFDVKMEGGLDGLQTIREIWKIDPQMHCTVVTAYHDRSIDDIDQLFGPAFKDQWDYLNKPFTQAEITQKARQMTAAWNRMRSLERAMEMVKATQAQLVRSERFAAIGQVARAIGHEFGNLLQAIMGKADLAMIEKDHGKLQEKLQIIMQASERASLIVKNLQSFSKTGNERSSVHPPKLIRDMLTLVNHQLNKNTIQVTDKCAPCGPIQANAGEIEQVLLNLVINATHAMPGGGKLEVGCRDGDDNASVQIWVRDSGTGIAPEVLPRIFDYAFTTKGDKGSGLGLSISKGIIENHGGTLLVETELGKGTVFTLQLPKTG